MKMQSERLLIIRENFKPKDPKKFGFTWENYLKQHIKMYNFKK